MLILKQWKATLLHGSHSLLLLVPPHSRDANVQQVTHSPWVSLHYGDNRKGLPIYEVLEEEKEQKQTKPQQTTENISAFVTHRTDGQTSLVEMQPSFS